MNNEPEKKDEAVPQEGETPEPTAGEDVPAEDTLAEENERLLDRLMRLQAEFENYRKRIGRERTEWEDRAMEGLVLELLPVLDSFERALEPAGAATDVPEGAAVLEGMRMVYRQLTAVLAARGVEPIDALGETFDPGLHEAFLSRPVLEGEEPGTIVEEVVRGYRLGSRTIRATKGIVAIREQESDSPTSPEEE